MELPYYCRRGVCRSCRQVTRGARLSSAATLTPAEREAGWELLCVSRPREDLEIDA
jgi:ferredoxin